MITNKDIAELLVMLTPRPSKIEEDEWADQWCMSLPKARADTRGNVWVTVGEPNGIMFCSHIDTVHRSKCETPVITIVAGSIQAYTLDFKHRLILGADDTVGVWIMRRMVEAKIPGTYIFHRDEESGGGGSRYIAENAERMFAEVGPFSIAIAFDRRGTEDIITHQGSRRCCSEVFSDSLAEQLNKGGLGYKSCDGGSFTDTKNYADLIPECTNISVGYYSQHSVNEYIDLVHLIKLSTAILEVDWSALQVARDPSLKEYKNWAPANQRYYTDEWDGYLASRKIIIDPDLWIQEALLTKSNAELMNLINRSPYYAALAVDLLLRHYLGITEEVIDVEPGVGGGATTSLPKDGTVEEPEGQQSVPTGDVT
jgi:hypothetical protein